MGFGSLLGSAIKRPFKDIHKAVRGSGKFMNRGFGKMTKGINQTGKNIFGKSQPAGPLTQNAPPTPTAPEIPKEGKGSQGKKKGEWIGSKYVGPK